MRSDERILRSLSEGVDEIARFLQRILRSGLRVLGKILQPPHFIRPNLALSHARAISVSAQQ